MEVRRNRQDAQSTDGVFAQRPMASAEKTPQVVDKRSLSYVVKSGIAGGLAGCAAKTLVAPLDRVKILFQASSPEFIKYTGSWSGLLAAMREIQREDGIVRGLFRGHSATLLRIFPYAGIKFLAYEQARAVLIPDRAHETAGRRLLAGALAGTTSVFISYPLEVVRVRLAFETHRDAQKSSLARICKQIYHEHPPTPLPENHPPRPNPTLASSSATALHATAATTEKVMQEYTPSRLKGLSNFYRGFTPTLVGMVPYAGFSFLTHDLAGDVLRWPRLAPYTTIPTSPTSSLSPSSTSTATSTSNITSPPRPRLNDAAQLFAGALAGLVSQTASYPLEVIRRRMQVGGAVGDGARHGMIETAQTIFRERGVRGFFVGLGIGYVKVVPMVAASFWTYERCKTLFGI